jgi:hypothetical protein
VPTPSRKPFFVFDFHLSAHFARKLCGCDAHRTKCTAPLRCSVYEQTVQKYETLNVVLAKCVLPCYHIFMEAHLNYVELSDAQALALDLPHIIDRRDLLVAAFTLRDIATEYCERADWAQVDPFKRGALSDAVRYSAVAGYANQLSRDMVDAMTEQEFEKQSAVLADTLNPNADQLGQELEQWLRKQE